MKEVFRVKCPVYENENVFGVTFQKGNGEHSKAYHSLENNLKCMFLFVQLFIFRYERCHSYTRPSVKFFF